LNVTVPQFDQWLGDPARPPLVMGVLNVTPDSFSDGGRFADARTAIEHATGMAADGAHIIDVGGESTRPGAQRVAPEEQLRRILPVIDAIRGRIGALVSVDTTRAAVARAAIDHGASLINDISAGTDDPDMLPLAARTGAALILMHMRGQPATMQAAPVYSDVCREVADYLQARRRAAVEAGVSERRILLDPGIGFGKTVDHNLALLAGLRNLAALGPPIVIGTSRKSFIGRLTGEDEPGRRLAGTAATVAWSVANGAAIVRVHDVESMAKVVRVIQAILRGRAG
jgi:dihydropteroate synthase